MKARPSSFCFPFILHPSAFILSLTPSLTVGLPQNSSSLLVEVVRLQAPLAPQLCEALHRRAHALGERRYVRGAERGADGRVVELRRNRERRVVEGDRPARPRPRALYLRDHVGDARGLAV